MGQEHKKGADRRSNRTIGRAGVDRKVDQMTALIPSRGGDIKHARGQSPVGCVEALRIQLCEQLRPALRIQLCEQLRPAFHKNTVVTTQTWRKVGHEASVCICGIDKYNLFCRM